MKETVVTSKANIPSLDGWRALAILIVLLSHAGWGKIIPGGLGVTLFFFLSGYLITTLIMEEYRRDQAINICNFYIRRILRLVPTLTITLLIAYGLTLFQLLPGGITWQGFLAQLFYFANYYTLFFDPGSTTPQGTGILWSLSVEEHFYIAYPLIVSVILTKTKGRHMAFIFAAACIGALVWRVHLSGAVDFNPNRTYYATDTRFDSILYGCVLALVKNPAFPTERHAMMKKHHKIVFIISLIALAFTILYRDPQFRETFRYSLQGIALMPLFYLSIKFWRSTPFKFLNVRPIKIVGVYSYSIYLIHYIFIKLINPHTNSPIIIFALSAVLAIAYAAIMDKYVERFFKDLRKSFR
ncbi:acyltransferase [Methylobacter sp. Wu1]|uniref:acyltransferase family protein n=1 Tax=Methylobacter sp. Wu1 TaxID=3119359 RepID=UPI002F92703C